MAWGGSSESGSVSISAWRASNRGAAWRNHGGSKHLVGGWRAGVRIDDGGGGAGISVAYQHQHGVAYQK